MKKKTFIGLGSLLILVLLFCSVTFVAQKVNACGWLGCQEGTNTTLLNEQAAIEQNQQRLDATQRLPMMTDSQERKNLIRRAQTFNNENKISYIYLYSFGKLIMYDTVKGKVS